MKKTIKSFAIVVGALGGALLTTYSVFASNGWSGSGGNSLGGGGGGSEDCSDDYNSASRVDCTGVSWLKYEYIDGSGFHDDYKFVPNGPNNSLVDGGELIGAECAKPGVGFYHLGINIRGNKSILDGYESYGNTTYNGITNYWNTVSTTALNYVNQNDPRYSYTYRLNGKNTWGHRLSLTIDGAGSYYENMYKGNDGRIYSHLLYYKGEPVYKSESSITDTENILRHYVAFLNNMYPGGKDADGNEASNAQKGYIPDKGYSCSYSATESSWICTDMPRDIYAFCAFPLENPATLSPKATITIDGHSKSTSYNFSASRPTDTAEDTAVYTVNDSTVKVTGDFNFKIDKSIRTTSFTPVLSVGGQSVPARTLSFSGASAEIPDGLGPTAKTKTVTLEANKETKICVSATTQSTISSTNISGEVRKAEACITVKYVPHIAKIASITKANVKIGGNSDEFKSSPNSVKTDASKTEIRPGLVTITWSHEIYAYCEYVLGNTASCGNSSTDIGGSLGRSYNAHYAADLGGLSASSSYKTLGTKNNVDLGQKTNKYLFPGERYTEEGDIWHYKEERSDGSPNGTGDGNKINSGVKVTLTASEIVCSINGEKFGLNNPRNYGRLTVIKTGGTNGTYYYGNYSDGIWKDDGSIWLNPYDNIQLRYEACIGSQISKDKESRAAWSDKLANEHNASLAVKTTGNAFDKTLYKGSGNAVDGALSGGKNIISSEVIGDNIQGHISNNYQFIGSKAVKTSNAVVGHLGQTINNDFGGDFSGCGGGRTDCLARATMKIPYNYILEPTVSGGSGGDIVTLGDSNTFQISINNKDVRTNEKVQSTPYHTNAKPGTTAGYLKFAANTETTTSELLKSINGKFVRGNYTSNIEDALASAGLDDIENPESGVINQLNNNGGIKNNAERYIKVSSDIAESDYNKICVALAVYPADSHNKEGAEKISDDDQSVALTGEFGGAYTRISVACKTVGKYPSASVEGNGIVTGSIITGSRTEYGGRIFGSWTEYGLVANGVTNIASGASSAYDNPQSSRNASVPYNEAGLKIGNFDSIQTIGNMASTIGAFSNASVYAAQARIYADSVITTFFNDDLGAGPIVDAGGATYVNANYDSDVAIDSDLAELINEAANNGQVIIYSTGDIKISNAVAELNATLIADGKVDTCTEADQGGDNEQLLDNCSNSLIINGVVYSEQPIALDRVYGGGSVEAMDLDADTLIQRAEILNYDPKIVKWSYDYKRQTQPLTTTYIEELSTRY